MTPLASVLSFEPGDAGPLIGTALVRVADALAVEVEIRRAPSGGPPWVTWPASARPADTGAARGLAAAVLRQLAERGDLESAAEADDPPPVERRKRGGWRGRR